MSKWIKWVGHAVRDPSIAISYIRGSKVGVNITCLRRISTNLGHPQRAVDAYLNQILSDEKFNQEVWTELRMLDYKGWISFPEGLYTLMRIIKPEIVVETGVAAGVSSTYILKALEDNGKGELFSIDLPNYELEYFPKLGIEPVAIIPKGKEVGFVIPANLRHRWHLILGKSQEVLPKLLDNHGLVDCFLHDSEHTYENMIFEYTEAWEHLRGSGVLLSDNVFMNSGFHNFSKLKMRKPLYVYFAGWGCIVK